MALAKLATEVSEGRYATAGPLTLAGLIDRFLEVKANRAFGPVALLAAH